MKHLSLSYYIDLIQSFLSQEIDIHKFEQIYLQSFKEDQTLWANEEFEILDGLFCDIDALCIDLNLRSADDLDEDQLRRRCEAAIVKLRGDDCG